KTGYVYVIGGKGGERGHYIVSQRGERDGENIWESRDSEGRYIIKEIVGKALTLKPGEFATIRYAWQNLGESSPRWKIARLVYYEPWDWVIGTSVYEDELQSYRKMLSDGQTAMISIMGLAGLAVMVLVGMLCFFVAWTIVAPVRKMTQVAKDISQGQMNKVVDIKSNDEIGVLSDAFSTMINRLNQAMEGLKQENREREKTEKELMESERRYKEIFNSTSDALFIHAEDGTIIDVNERMCQMFGCRREDAIGRSVAIFTAGESGYSGEEAKRLIQKAIGEGYQTFEWRSKRVTGELFWVEVALRFCEIAGEKRVIASARDITERKMTEAELLKNEAVQRSMLQGTPVGVCLLKDRKMWKVNDSLCRISGYAEEDLVGEDSRLLYMNDEEYNRVGHIIYERSANNATAFAESRLKRKDGSLVDVEIYLSPFDPNNPEGGVTATIVDVSERKRSEEALKKNEAVLNSMLQGTPVGVALLSKRKFWKVNSSLCRIIGYSEQELLGQETRVLYVDQAGYERVGKDTYEQMMRVGLGMAEAKLKRKDGTPIDVELYLSPFDPENMDAGITATVVDVTERKRAEAEKNRLMTILESTNDLVAMATFDGKVIYLNAAGRKMLGFTRSESLSGYDIEDAHPIAAYYKLQEESIPEACKKGIWDGETVIRTRSGREIPVLQTLMAHRSPKGDIQYLSTIVRDISERKRSEELLKKSEEKYRKIFDNTVEGIYQTTPEGRYLSVNPAFYKMFGFSSAEEMMSTVMDIGHQLYVNPNDRDRMIEMLREYDSISGFEVEVYKKDRSKFWISINVHTVRDADGRIIYFEGTNEDITKRKRVIEELRESEEKFSGVFRFSPEMIAITSLEDGLFFEVNDASVALLGYEKEELLNSTALKMGIWVFPSKRDEMVKEIKEKGAVSQVEQQFRRKDQQIITVLFSGAIIRTMEKEFLLSIVMDISGRKRAEEDLKIAKEQAEYASKAKTNFLLDVSHDIRTPINAIIGFNELLSKTALNATQKEFSGIIRKKSRDLIDLVARIIDISAIEEGKLRLNRSFFNIRDLAVDMAETVGILSREKDLSFFYEVQDDVPKELFGDAVRLRQVLENLCGNSVKYTKKGGVKIKLETE
ncbi:MAG TPA: PAS domain S-box protein, partial [Candidatus Omnitrophota bacterium]|nr:PAS domain S-box protein [Candidatus Omnitrophota bacterium]